MRRGGLRGVWIDPLVCFSPTHAGVGPNTGEKTLIKEPEVR
jgi:hypothetical protein